MKASYAVDVHLSDGATYKGFEGGIVRVEVEATSEQEAINKALRETGAKFWKEVRRLDEAMPALNVYELVMTKDGDHITTQVEAESQAAAIVTACVKHTGWSWAKEIKRIMSYHAEPHILVFNGEEVPEPVHPKMWQDGGSKGLMDPEATMFDATPNRFPDSLDLGTMNAGTLSGDKIKFSLPSEWDEARKKAIEANPFLDSARYIEDMKARLKEPNPGWPLAFGGPHTQAGPHIEDIVAFNTDRLKAADIEFSNSPEGQMKRDEMLHTTDDADIWAAQFCRVYPQLDFVSVSTWFENAMEAAVKIHEAREAEAAEHKRLYGKLEQVIGESIGEASMAWHERPAEVFNDTMASDIVNKTLAELHAYYDITPKEA